MRLCNRLLLAAAAAALAQAPDPAAAQIVVDGNPDDWRSISKTEPTTTTSPSTTPTILSETLRWISFVTSPVGVAHSS